MFFFYKKMFGGSYYVKKIFIGILRGYCYDFFRRLVIQFRLSWNFPAKIYEYPYELAGGNFLVVRFSINGGRVEYISLRTVDDSKERNWILENVRTI